jgi:predicted transcriptional regulator YdeE
MQPKIIEKERIVLAGMSFYGDPFDTSTAWTEENQIGLLWQRLISYFQDHAGTLNLDLDQEANYEVHIYGPQTEAEGIFEVFIGLRIHDLADVPYDLIVKVLPPARYAVFSLNGKAITSDWEQEIGIWLDANGYREAHPYNFQYYDDRFKGLDRIEESTLDVYIPIEEIS